ncbi:MAG: hypothetical protein ABI862_14745 [Ilumatobacteraceae bacterium]
MAELSRRGVGLVRPGGTLAGVFLGDDLLAYLVLALGGALFAGNLMALIKPPPPRQGDLAKAPIGRSVVMGLIGLVAAVWALASLIG